MLWARSCCEFVQKSSYTSTELYAWPRLHGSSLIASKSVFKNTCMQSMICMQKGMEMVVRHKVDINQWRND